MISVKSIIVWVRLRLIFYFGKFQFGKSKIKASYPICCKDFFPSRFIDGHLLCLSTRRKGVRELSGVSLSPPYSLNHLPENPFPSTITFRTGIPTRANIASRAPPMAYPSVLLLFSNFFLDKLPSTLKMFHICIVQYVQQLAACSCVTGIKSLNVTLF